MVAYGLSPTCCGWQPEQLRWVTDLRVREGSYLLEGTQHSPATELPDGGFVSVAHNGKILIANADGSERARVSLSGGPFRKATLVAREGAIFVVGEARRVYALRSDGSTQWCFGGRETFKAGMALSADGQTLYVADEKRNVYALDSATGGVSWRLTPSTEGAVLAEPGLGPDGTLYVLTDKGHLSAISRDGSSRWTFVAPGGAPFRLQPQLGRDGTIYIAGEDKHVFALRADGSLKYSVVTDSKILAQPPLGSDGSLYVATEQGGLYGLNPDGSRRFRFQPAEGELRTSPILSIDEGTDDGMG